MRPLPILALLCLSALVPAPGIAAPPSSPQVRTELVGQPVAIEVVPDELVLKGPRDVRQMVVTGKYADGSIRDLTTVATFVSERADLLIVEAGGFVRGRVSGKSAMTVAVGTQVRKIPVLIEGVESEQPVSFRREVIAAMNVGGCNQGACHGTPSGKNGFKLSLRGFEPALDYQSLSRDVLGRRNSPHNPLGSLLLLKGLGRVPHEGSARFGVDSLPVEMLAGWIGQGMLDDPATLPAVKKIEVLPGSRVLRAPARWQQVSVVAEFADGSKRDVTRLTNFSSSDPSIAEVSPTGLVEFRTSGEVAILSRYLDEMVAIRLTWLEARDGFVWPNPPANNFVDVAVFSKLKLMSIAPSGLCTDDEFVRRAYLDLCGILPKPEVVVAFLDDKSADKRARLVDSLLERPEYADFWTLKWSDVFRSSRRSVQLKGVTAFRDWMHDRVSRNAPFDGVVRELLTASGSTYSNAPANFYRISKEPTVLAETTAQLFLGVRMQCAKCHNHPFERWTQDDYYSLAAFFSRVKTRVEKPLPGDKSLPLEYVLSTREGEMTQPRTGKLMPPKFPGSAPAGIPVGQDRRAALADWLTTIDNPFFARSVVNRVWYHLMGKGIVDPVDDFRESNPPSNDELLAALAKDFGEHHFDLKHLIRTIANSRTYQLSSVPNASNREDGKYFSKSITKLLTAETLLDALCDVTGMPEKFAGLPMGTRAIQLPDGEVNHPFLKAFGQPARELACECERETDSNLGQALQMINGPTINEKVKFADNRLGKLLAAKTGDIEKIESLWLTALSRRPTEAEKAPALAHIAKATDKRRAWEDLMWALLNMREFLYRH